MGNTEIHKARILSCESLKIFFFFSLFLVDVDMESRSMHLSTLVQESQQRVTELSAQVMNEGLGTDNTEKEKQLKAWEWRYRLYKRMKAGYEHASK